MMEYPDHNAGLAGNQVLFEKKDSEELGESTVLQEKVFRYAEIASSFAQCHCTMHFI